MPVPNPLGPYRLERRLGGGGFADVYLAWDTRADRAVALKVLRPQHASGPTLARFLREGEQMLRLHHPHVVRVYETGEVAGYHYIAMEYLAGSLADLLSRHKRLDLLTATRIAGQVAAALDYVHRRGIVHRDLKPSNILLDAQGQAHVADFGVAHVAGELTLTPLGQQPGTVTCMAPEQVRPSLGQVSPATDTWALGVLIYEMLCGRSPFAGESWQTSMFQIVNDQPPSPSSLNPALPREVDVILRRALTKDPRRRYQQAGELAADLRRLAGSTPQPTGARRLLGTADQPSRSAVRHRMPKVTARSGTSRPGNPALWIILGSAGAITLLVVALTLLADRSGDKPLLTPVATPTTMTTIEFPRKAYLAAPEGSSQGYAYLYAAPDTRSGYLSLYLPDRPDVVITGDHVTGDVMFGQDSWYPAEYTFITQQVFPGYVPCAYVVWADSGQRACSARANP